MDDASGVRSPDRTTILHELTSPNGDVYVAVENYFDYAYMLVTPDHSYRLSYPFTPEGYKECVADALRRIHDQTGDTL